MECLNIFYCFILSLFGWWNCWRWHCPGRLPLWLPDVLRWWGMQRYIMPIIFHIIRPYETNLPSRYGFKTLSKYVKSWFLFCNRQMPNQLSECLPKWKKMLPLPLWQKLRYSHLWRLLLLRWWFRSMSGCNVLFNRYIFY